MINLPLCSRLGAKITVFALTAFSFQVLAAPPGLPWTKVAGVYGGSVQAVTEDTSGTLYAAAAGNGVFISHDGGNTWSLTPGLRKIDAVQGITSVAVDSSHTIYVGMSAGIWKSTNQGADFTQMTQGAPTNHVRALLFRSNGDLLAISNTGLTILPYGAAAWRQAKPLPFKYPYILSMALDPSHTALTVGAYGTNTLFTTRDWGSTWTATGAIPGFSSGNAVIAVAYDPTGHLYAGVTVNQLGVRTGGVAASPDGGRTWSPLQLTNTGVSSIFTVSGKVLVGTGGVEGGGALYVSSDQGKTYLRVTSGLGVMGPVTAITSTSHGIFATTNGVYHSQDSGSSWVPLNNLHVDRSVMDILTTKSGEIYVSSMNEGVSRSKDNGLTWNVINSGLDGNLTVGLLALNAQGEVIGSPSRTVGRSVRLPNNGNTWVQSNLSAIYLGIGLDKQNRVVAVCGTGNGVDTYVSTDGGTNFSFLSHVVRGWGTAGATSPSGNLYAGTEAAGGFYSNDNGATWISMGATPNNTGFGFAPNGTPFFINMDAHIMQFQGGTNWAISDKGTAYGFSATNFYTDHSGDFFVNGTSGSVYVSNDNGNTWSPFQAGLPVTKLRAAALGMDARGYLYTGYWGDLGLYRTSSAVGLP